MRARVFDIKCQYGPAEHPRPAAFGLAKIDITVGDGTVHHHIEANECNQPHIYERGDLSEALRGRGEWQYHFDADDEDYFHDLTPRRRTSLDIRVTADEIIVQTDQTSRIPLYRGTLYRRAISRAIHSMMEACDMALDYYYGECMECMFDD